MLPTDPKRTRILVADDSLEDRITLERYLTRGEDPFEVVTTETGAEALERCLEFRPHAVLVDYNLPDCDGLELLDSLMKSLPPGQRPVALVLTGQGDERIAVGAMKAGAADYIVKADLAPELLRERVRQALRQDSLQKALERSRDSFRTLVESAADAILVIRDLKIVYVNPALVELLGYQSDLDLLGRPVLDMIVHPSEHGMVAERVAEATARPLGYQLPRKVIRLIRGDGSCAWGDAVTVHTEFEGESATISMIRDVTERRRLEQRVRQSERLASLGTLAAGVAHEINNPLAGIMANLEYTLQELKPTLEVNADLEDCGDALRESYEAADRIAKIVRGMKSFSRAEKEEPRVLDLQAVLASAVNMSRTEVRHRAHLVQQHGALPPVYADEVSMTQVLINLVVNAAQCYPPGDAADHPIHLTTRTDTEGRAVVEVRDEGPGIPDDTMARIFDPFFTTKETGQGTGLGLSIAHGLVQAAGGSLECESVVGRGTTFRIALPPSEIRPPAEHEPEPHWPASNEDRARILVIDDEAIVGTAVRRCLERRHDVVVLRDGASALELISSGEQFDVVFCDLMMPKMTGMEFHRRLDEAHPEQARRVIFMTGGAFTPEATEFVNKLEDALIQKPFTPATLRLAIENLGLPVG